MKNILRLKHFVFSALIMLSFFTSCAQKEISIDSLEQKGNQFYDQETGQPFEGIAVFYDENGKVSGRTSYKNGVPNGTEIKYYPDGKVKSKIEYVDFYRNGPAVFYYPNGQIMKKGNYVNCFEEGKWDFYYENGQLKESGSFKNGLKSGSWNYYSSKGKLLKTVVEKDDELKLF